MLFIKEMEEERCMDGGDSTVERGEIRQAPKGRIGAVQFSRGNPLWFEEGRIEDVTWEEFDGEYFWCRFEQLMANIPETLSDEVSSVVKKSHAARA